MELCNELRQLSATAYTSSFPPATISDVNSRSTIGKSPISLTRSFHRKPIRRKSRSASVMAILSPRSSNYERLEDGRGPSKAGGKFAWTWKRFVIGAVVFIGLVCVFGPRERRTHWIGGEDKPPMPNYGGITDEDYNMIPDPNRIPHDSNKPPSSSSNENNVSTAPPTSADADPDLLKTAYCTHSFKPGVPLVQYALMIDAGSTGSRIHIYKFNNCGPSPAYEYEVFKQRRPGLSAYKGEPLGAASSLDELMDEAVRVVPESLWNCTPVAVKATAGLRLLGAVESAEILEAVRQRLREKYQFNLRSDEDVVIMDGKDEGVYAWITANYLLDTIRANSPPESTSYAVLDLGGASTQIVFEPGFDEKRPDSMLEEGEHKYDLDFAGKKRVLYQHSYLGYGLMKARESVHSLVEFLAPVKDLERETITNPCLARGTMKEVNITNTKSGVKEVKTVKMDGADVGSFEACNRVVQLVMAKDTVCEVKPCSFNGVYQPSLLETFSKGKILLLSYFYDRTNPLLTSSERSSQLKISSISSIAEDVCLGPSSWLKRWGNNKEAMEELEGRPEWCLDLTFMHSLLRLGYEFSEDRDAVIGKQIDGTELGWCLGATIAMVGADLKCRV